MMKIGFGDCPECGRDTVAISGHGYISPDTNLDELPPSYVENCTECDWETTNSERFDEVFDD